jgi:hypothetical protein
MKTLLPVLLLMLATTTCVLGYDSGIAIQTEEGTSIQVSVNGKLYNKHPGKIVRVRSTSGLFHLEVKVLNPWNKQWYIVRKNVRIEKGFEFQYKVIFSNKLNPEIVEVKKYPIYSKYFLNPMLYNRHPVS